MYCFSECYLNSRDCQMSLTDFRVAKCLSSLYADVIWHWLSTNNRHSLLNLPLPVFLWTKTDKVNNGQNKKKLDYGCLKRLNLQQILRFSITFFVMFVASSGLYSIQITMFVHWYNQLHFYTHFYYFSF